ncbi:MULTISPECIES: glycosyltransferase [unclassified Cryobacterium]|uniref:glycosyltransferase n=1 Tax=unclassified Cryobacterium TaxID=2649013 RepID=UPI001F542E6B|nr:MULTISPECIES: glycosyltransferase [unclassified Cryobacterium]
MTPERPHEISVVIPVYQGEQTLPALIAELQFLTNVTNSPDGYGYLVREVLLVCDNGPDESPRIMRELSDQYDFVRPIWLSRNYGQHAATLAGMASSGSEWIVTLDEDGQHDPAEIGGLLDTAMREQASVVYAKPTNPAPHGYLRNSASSGAKWLLTKLFTGSNAPDYQSYRLILGNIGRSVAAYSGSGVYLDVAMGWVAGKVVTSPVRLRGEGDRRSGYSARRLFSHFWSMILSSGTRALRFVSILGVAIGLIGAALAMVIGLSRLFGNVVPEGWASTIVIVLLSSGAVLFSLGVIAEYIGVNVNMAMGKPPYLITTDPSHGPLGRRHQHVS